jgi:hypothetical protein
MFIVAGFWFPRMPIENIYFWPTVDVRDSESTWAAW